MAFFKQPTVFVRHGQTQWNAEKRTQGHLNAPLTETCRQQAKAVAQKLAGKQFDMLLSSPLGRAVETANILKTELSISIPLQIHYDLAERNLGVLQGRTQEETMREFPQFWDATGHFIQASEIPGGESFTDFLSRIKRMLKDIQTLSEKKRIVVVTHDGVLHAVTSQVKNISFNQVQEQYKFNHTEPVVFE